MGRYAGTKFSSYDMIAEKQEEIERGLEREDRRGQGER